MSSISYGITDITATEHRPVSASFATQVRKSCEKYSEEHKFVFYSEFPSEGLKAYNEPST